LGNDPSRVLLIFADGLDNTVDVVMPMSFTLRRSRQSPLIARYQIALQGLNIPLQPGIPDLVQSLVARDAKLSAAAMASMQDSSAMLAQASAGGLAQVPGVGVSLLAYANTAQTLIAQVQNAKSIAAGLSSFGKQFTQGGLNLMHAVTSLSSLSSQVRSSIMSAGSAFSNLNCLFNNAIGASLTMPDFSDLFGASNCSSTSGGSPISPLAGQNPWALIFPQGGGSIAISAPAQASLSALAICDPVLFCPSLAQLAANAQAVASGVRFS
jgi:hypothetical protein